MLPARSASRKSDSRLRRHVRVAHWRAGRLDPAVRGFAWMVTSGIVLMGLNASMRLVARQIDTFEAQFLRYVMGFLVLVPMFLRTGLAVWRPRSVGGQFSRGVVHTLGLTLWFLSIPHIELAEITALGFTTPIFVMVGAALILGERMPPTRAVAAAIGLAGVAVVVWPQLSGSGGIWLLVMLSTSPLFAASFLVTKAQTRYERPQVIVAWQAITVATLSMPMAFVHWQWPTAFQWFLFVLGGLLGTTGQYCQTRAFALLDVSATQPMRFLELVWASLFGWVLFGDVPSRWTVLGGVIICSATVWIARRESRGARASRPL